MTGGRTLGVSFDVTNTSDREGYDTPQLYAAHGLAEGYGVRHFAGWKKLFLKPGETQRVTLAVDPRLIAHFDTTRHDWQVEGGRYRAEIGRFAGDVVLSGEADVASQQLKP